MKLSRLLAIAQLFSSYQQIFSLRRVGDNLFCLVLDFDEYYLDMSKGNSDIFRVEHKIIGNAYQAPFDLALLKYSSRAKILKCSLDGFNRILVFELLYALAYKQERVFLYFEFTGRHTNVILVDEEQRVIESLRHISSTQSSRAIQPSKPFTLLPQPKIIPNFVVEEVEGLKQKLLQVYEVRNLNVLNEKKQILISSLQKKIDATQERLLLLPKQEELREEERKFLQWGNAILANLYQLSFFQSRNVLRDFDNKEIEVILPSKIYSYPQGVDYCFNQSKKAKRKLQNLIIQEQNLKDKIIFLQKKMEYIGAIQDVEELKLLMPKGAKKAKSIQKDYESFFIDGFKISMGKNAKENQKLLEDARADDLWLHLQSIPSSHMIIHCGKQSVREELIYKSAKILAGLNGFLDKNIVVDYTKRKFVRIVEGANVIYSKQKSLRV